MEIKNINVINFKYCDSELRVVFKGRLNNSGDFLKEMADLIKKYEEK